MEALSYLEDLCVRRYGEWANLARQADLIVFQAEGTMSGRVEFRTGAGIFLLPFVAKHAWGKRVIAMNQTLFSVDPGITEMVTHALRDFDFVAVREGFSVEFARSAGISCAYVPDAAFRTKSSPDVRLPDLDGPRRYFCVTGSALAEKNIAEHIVELADRIRKSSALIPVLAAASDQSLVKIASQRWRDGDYVVVPSDIHYPAVAYVLERCEFLVGGRYHMAIMAAAVGTPTLLLRGNTAKNEGLAAMLRSAFPVRSTTEIDAILSDAKALLGNLPHHKAVLRKAVSEILETIERATEVIADGIRTGIWRSFTSDLPTVSSSIAPIYAEAAARKRLPKNWPPGDAPIELSQILSPLLAGFPGDRAATARVIERILAHSPEYERCLTRDQVAILKAYSLI
jgi:polysaccharide pyruvyl transferase WcaK-like protein